MRRRAADHTGRPIVIEGRSIRSALETGRNRLILAAGIFLLAFATVGWRLVDVVTRAEAGLERAAVSEVRDKGARADIVDRNGMLLATSLVTYSAFADPAEIIDARRAADRLATVLPSVNPSALAQELEGDKRFVWIERNLTPALYDQVNRLGIPGVHFRKEPRRVYPQAELTAHIVGGTDVDGKGIAGVERSFDETLLGGDEPLQLSLDIRVQHIVRQELLAAIEEFQAIGGAGMVMDIATGELIAMVSLPDFDPHVDITQIPEENQFNRNTLGVYELGSTFKIFNTALALDSGTVGLAGGFDATNPIRISRFQIRDYHAKRRWLSVPEIFRYSSNIGSAKMAVAAGTKTQQRYLGAFGLTEKSPVELPEVGRPQTPSPWREINTMTISFGHGIAVAPVQLVSAVGAVVNDGVKVPATLLRRTSVPAGLRVLRPEVSLAMRKLLRDVVEKGSGRNADAEGYLVGGKTGTAEKAGRGGYRRKALISSFVAAFPMDAPRYVVFAMLDEPQGNEKTHFYATAGWVAAPTVKKLIQRIAPMLGVRPLAEGDQVAAGWTDIQFPAPQRGKRSGGKQLASH